MLFRITIRNGHVSDENERKSSGTSLTETISEDLAGSAARRNCYRPRSIARLLHRNCWQTIAFFLFQLFRERKTNRDGIKRFVKYTVGIDSNDEHRVTIVHLLIINIEEKPA